MSTGKFNIYWSRCIILTRNVSPHTRRYLYNIALYLSTNSECQTISFAPETHTPCSRISVSACAIHRQKSNLPFLPTHLLFGPPAQTTTAELSSFFLAISPTSLRCHNSLEPWSKCLVLPQMAPWPLHHLQASHVDLVFAEMAYMQKFGSPSSQI
jgi:hypothetical protein